MEGPETSSTSQKFLYQKIAEPRQIRLLRAFSNPKSPSEIRCEFSLVCLDRLLCGYNAISYCWGDSTKTGAAWASEDQYLAVTSAAMSVLTTVIATNPKEYFWIDALCINQNDDDEKGQQVQLMGEIYATAQTVIAWLGEPTLESSEALEFAKFLVHTIKQLEEIGESVNLETLTRLPLCEYPSAHWMALRLFLERPWFERVWIIQEVVAAPSVSIICGDKIIAWETLAFLVLSIQSCGLEHTMKIDVDGNPKRIPVGYLNIQAITVLRMLSRSDTPPELIFCLLVCPRFKATDARDMLFAIRGMASDATDAALDPSYNDSPEKVYTRWTVYLLTERIGGSIILHIAGIGYERKLSDLPSWVPDWTSVNFSALATYSGNGYNSRGKLDSRPLVTFDPSSATITLRGQIVGVVGHFVRNMPETVGNLSDIKGLKENAAEQSIWLTQVSKLFSCVGPYHTGEPLFPDVVGRTLVSNLVDDSAPADELPGYFSAYCEMIQFPGAIDCIDDIASLSSDTRHSAEIYAAKLRRNNGRAIFATEKAYLGVGPPLLRKGDLVCIFIGFCTPFIIRRRLQCGYALVGECYVHGLMSEEGSETREGDNVKLF